MYRFIDSISFEFEYDFRYFPEEEFKFTLSGIRFVLVRKKRPVAEKVFEGGTSFYIGDLLKKGKLGDQLIIDYYPEW